MHKINRNDANLNKSKHDEGNFRFQNPELRF